MSSEWSGRIYGCLDVPLSERGREEARHAAHELRGEPLAMVVSSGLVRAEFGAALLREPRGLPRIDDPDLREIDRGAWTGRSFEQLAREEPGAWRAWLSAPDTRRPPQGESLGDVAARVLPRIDHWVRACPGSVLAIVAHRWVIRTATCHLRGVPLAQAAEQDVPTGTVVALDWPVSS